jgi:prepilin-type processing-associated H-X9-DG protein
VFVCPDDTTFSRSSYAYNSNNTQLSLDSGGNGISVDGVPIAQYASPAKTVLLFEVAGNHFGSTDSWTVPTDATTAPGGYSPAGYGAGNGTWMKAIYGAGVGGNMQIATGYFKKTTTADHATFLAATGRHTDGANYLMADTHAKWLRGAAVEAGLTNPTSTDCNTAGAVEGVHTGVIYASGPDCSDSTVAATFSL